MRRQIGEATIAVHGATVAAMAAAARLAKQGHRVTLVVADPDQVVAEAASHLLPHPVGAPSGGGTDFTFPAPWRDLFRKSGRPLEAELARHGLRLVDAPGRRLGAGAVLPPERGAQFATLRERYGVAVAERWRDLLDGLDDLWQIRRALGMERPYDARAHRRADLWPGRSVADLATGLPDDLAALVRATASTDPRRSPAVDAVWLAVERAFGRWHLVDADDTVQPARRLLEVLAGRLATRGVAITTAAPSRATATLDATPRTPRGPWYRRPGPRGPWSPRRHHYRAGEHTPAGTGAVGELFSAALATYALHRDLTGVDIQPSMT